MAIRQQFLNVVVPSTFPQAFFVIPYWEYDFTLFGERPLMAYL
jgi:hypothetical protein